MAKLLRLSLATLTFFSFTRRLLSAGLGAHHILIPDSVRVVGD
jgi:hypothetical protein